MSRPAISVVLPVRNGASTIGAQLEALAGQVTDEAWELVVADNGSTDATVRVVEAWSDRLPDLRVVDASSRRGPAHARNVGVHAAVADRILLCDADDVVSPQWVGELGGAVGDAALVAGPLERARLNADRPHQWGAAVNPTPGVRTAHHFLPAAPTNNLGFQRRVFDEVGGFDPGLQRGEDTDFCWRAIRAGAVLTFVPTAIVHVRLRSGRRAAWRQGVGDGRSAPALYRRYRRFGMHRDLRGDVMAVYRDVATQLRWLAARDGRAERAAYDAGQCVGRVLGSARERVIFL